MRQNIPEGIFNVVTRGVITGLLIIAGSILGKNAQLTFIVDFDSTVVVVLSIFGCLLILANLCLFQALLSAYWVVLIISWILLLPWLICVMPLLVFWTQHPQTIIFCIVFAIIYTPIGLLAFSSIRLLNTHKNFFFVPRG